LYNWDGVCLLRGTDRIFIYNAGLHTSLHLHVALTRRTKGRKPGDLPKSKQVKSPMLHWNKIMFICSWTFRNFVNAPKEGWTFSDCFYSFSSFSSLYLSPLFDLLSLFPFSYVSTIATIGTAHPSIHRANKSVKYSVLVLFIYSLTHSLHISTMSIPDNIQQGCTNPGRLVAKITKFCTVAPNIFGSSVRKHVTFLAPRILKWLLDFRKICIPSIDHPMTE
jgi:hypothetical protein